MRNLTKHINFRVFIIGLLFLAISAGPRIPLPISIPGRVFDLRLEDIIIFFFMLILTLNFLIKGQTKTRFFSVPLITPISIYFLTVILTTTIALIVHEQSLSRILLYTLKETEFFLIFLLVTNFIRSETELKTVSNTILTAGILNICWVAYQIFSHHHGPLFQVTVPEIAYQHGARFAFYFIASIGEVSPFSVASLFAFISFLFYAYSFFLYRTEPIKRKILLGIGLACTACSMCTMEKISVVFFITGIILLTLLSEQKIRNTILLIFLFIILSVVANYVIQTTGYHQRLFSRSSYMGSVTGDRIPIWKSLWPYAIDNIFLGVGKGGYNLYSNTEPIALFEEAHNGYLRILLESGILGLITFLWLLLQVGILCKNVFKHSTLKISKTVSSATLCILWGLIFASTVQDGFKTILPNMIFWYFVGLTTVAGRLEQRIEK